MQMGTNVVGHFKFTALLFDLCKAAPQCRIVVVSSNGHRYVRSIDFDDFNKTKSYIPWNSYYETKLGNLLFVRKLNRIIQERGVTSVIAVACHPGISFTNLGNHLSIAKYFGFLVKAVIQSSEMGAKPTVLAAIDENAKADGYAGPSGCFELSGEPKWDCYVNPSVESKDLQDQLWNKCEDITKVGFVSRI